VLRAILSSLPKFKESDGIALVLTLMHAAWIVKGAGAKPNASQIASLNSLWSAAAYSGNFPAEVNRTASFHTC